VGGHAVILLKVYYHNSNNIEKAEVFDPWPGRGYRYLLPAEMVPSANGFHFAVIASIQ